MKNKHPKKEKKIKTDRQTERKKEMACSSWRNRRDTYTRKTETETKNGDDRTDGKEWGLACGQNKNKNNNKN